MDEPNSEKPENMPLRVGITTVCIYLVVAGVVHARSASVHGRNDRLAAEFQGLLVSLPGALLAFVLPESIPDIVGLPLFIIVQCGFWFGIGYGLGKLCDRSEPKS